MVRSLLMALALSGALASGQALAVSSDTLGNLVAGGSLAAGAMRLTNWDAGGIDTTDLSGEVDLGNIRVTATAVDDDTFTVTFDFNGALTITGVDVVSDFVDLAMSYTLSFADRYVLESLMLGMESDGFDPSDTVSSFNYAEEYVYANAGGHDPSYPEDNALPLDPGARIKLTTEVNPGMGTNVTSDSGALGSRRKSVFIYKNTLTNVGTGETAGIERIVQTYNTTPEPGAWALMASGLWLLGRRRPACPRFIRPASGRPARHRPTAWLS